MTVKVRETDSVGLKGGHLRFLGRSIFRQPWLISFVHAGESDIFG